MNNITSNKSDNHLKEMDFIAWAVHRTKDARKEKDIAKILSSRPRQRSGNHLN